MFMIFMPKDASLFLETPFMSGILTEAPRISGFLEISFRQWVHYPFRLPYQMEELFVVILTIFVNDVWNLPRISLMDSWTQHPILLNLFHHKLFDTSESEQSEPEQDLPAAVSTPEGHDSLLRRYPRRNRRPPDRYGY